VGRGGTVNSKDVEVLAVLVKVNGKVYQVMTSDKNKDAYLNLIAACENGVKIIDKPLEELTIERRGGNE
jgi:hypothetical protein